MDADITVPGEDAKNLPESYVIFITENDIYKKGKPLYKIDRYIDGEELFNDEAHIIYVNGEYKGNDPIGDLMHDFHCKKADDMKSKLLAERTRYLKENEKVGSGHYVAKTVRWTVFSESLEELCS